MWIIYALLTAFLLATSDAIAKKVLAVRDEYLVACMRLLFALPLFVITLLLIDVPSLDRIFWVSSSIALPLEIAAIILYVKALKVSPMSFSIPFLTLTPVFLVGISYFLLGEKISLIGGAGIILISAGGYMLNIHKAWGSPMEPLRAVLKERGVLMMIAVAFIFSMTSSLGKMAIEHSSPLFFGGFYFIMITLIFTPVAIWKNKGKIEITRRDIVPLSLAGITYFLMIIFHMVAISLTQVAYMISVKRMSIFFSIMYGYLIFRERDIRERVLGSIVMFAGFLLIVLHP